MNWKLLFALLAVGLFVAGCAGREAQAPATPPGGEITAPPPEEVTPPAEPEAPAEEPAPPAEEPAPPAEETPPAEEPPAEEPPAEPSGDGLGDLFQVDTDEPLEGSGYEVPSVEEE